jgi:hypothetical protein
MKKSIGDAGGQKYSLSNLYFWQILSYWDECLVTEISHCRQSQKAEQP